MKKVILIIVAVVILGAGGFFGYEFFAGGKKAEKPHEVKITDLTAEQITALTIKGEGTDPMIETNLADGGSVSLKYDVVLADDKAKTEFEARSTQMLSIALGTVRSQSSHALSGGNGKLFLETALKNKFNSLMKEGKVLEVYITSMNLY